jgi:hypothetical protein
MGAACFGAVFVVGGAENVRSPRLPKLPLRPGRASATAASKPMVDTAMTATRTKLDRDVENHDIDETSDVTPQ